MKSSRRQMLKSGMLMIGGLAVTPHLSFSRSLSPLKFTKKGNLLYSPFFEEYVDSAFPENTTELLAKLNANENPYGPSPLAIRAHEEGSKLGNRYAWKDLFELVDKIALKEGVRPENIIMGPGSSDILEKFGMVLHMHGGNIISADPAYMSMIKVAEAVGAEWKGVKLHDDWSHDLESMEKAVDAETKLVYICNPNNPTGSITDAKKLKEFCKKVSEKVPVFVDEAYMEFLPDEEQMSMASLVSEGYDVIVARTFSKIHGMAGLRVGYGVAQTSTLEQIQSITRGGMGISYPSVKAALASMEDSKFREKSRNRNAEARAYVCEELKKRGFDYVPSVTSFVLFPIQMEGKAFLKKMTNEKVGVRAFKIYNKNWCRVSIGTMEEMKFFVNALDTVLS